MRKKIVAGNWKMNTNLKEGIELAKAVAAKSVETPENVGLIVAAPFTHLCAVAEAVKGSKVEVSAQNCADHEKGAYTGEVSVGMLTSVGCQWTILGHSERRQYHAESDMLINAKAKILIENGIKPIICVGESLEQREMGLTMEHIAYQVKAALSGISSSELRKCVIAYEPIWAIGTGKTATSDQAQEVCGEIRAIIRKMYGARSARAVQILYGASMNAKNAAELLAQPDIDGGLIGGASLKPVDFSVIVKATEQ